MWWVCFTWVQMMQIYITHFHVVTTAAVSVFTYDWEIVSESRWTFFFYQHGSLNVPIEHHPTIRYMVYNGYYKVMSNIPKMGQLPTPDQWPAIFMWKVYHGYLQLHLTRPMGIIIPSQTKHVRQTESHSSYVYIHTYIYIYYIYIIYIYIYVCIQINI